MVLIVSQLIHQVVPHAALLALRRGLLDGARRSAYGPSLNRPLQVAHEPKAGFMRSQECQ